MDDVEAAVRRSLTQRADTAPVGGELLHRVRVETRRRRRRDRMGVVAAVVVGLVTFATLAVRLPLGTGEQPATPLAPQSLAAGAVHFGSGDVYAVTFPYSPGARLGDLESPYVTLVAGNPTLDYSSGMDDATVRVRRDPPSIPAEYSTIPMRGVKGFGWHDHSHRQLVWQERPDRWIEIRVPMRYELEVLAQYAEALGEAPMPMTQPFTFTLVPLGLIVDNIGPAAVTFRPPDLPPDMGFAGKITVTLSRAEEAPQDGRPYPVDGAMARVTSLHGGTVAWVDRADGRAVAVQVAEDLVVDESELAWFAAGIRPTGIARTASG
jgi:hypothetical protein